MEQPTVLILLSTWNGARYLPEQLASYLAQRDVDWHLIWRDDGSSDGTLDVLRAFAAGPGAGRCTEITTARGRLGVMASFITLLRAAQTSRTDGAFFAFSDQDDVWLPDKLARGVRALLAEKSRVKLRDGARVPLLYCARSRVVTETLAERGLSALPRRAPAFPMALTHNLATGCTMILDRAAAELVGASAPPAVTLHDWWAYIVVSGAGGRIVYDPDPVVLYRQHEGNLVGVPSGWINRGWAALRRGPRVFMGTFRAHVAALQMQPALLAPSSRAQIEQVAQALRGGRLARLRCLSMPGLRRQSALETALFVCWFLLG